MSELPDGTLETMAFGAVLFLGSLGLMGVHTPRQSSQPYNGPIPEKRQDSPPQEVAYDNKSRQRLREYLEKLTNGDSGPQSNKSVKPNPQFLRRHRHADTYQY
jgi:hypothetical protein